MKFSVEIVETYTKVVEITAKTPEEALEKVRSLYRNEEIKLNDDDFFDFEISIFY